MKKVFIEPSLEMKEFNRISVLAASETGNVTSAKASLTEVHSIDEENIATAVLR